MKRPIQRPPAKGIRRGRIPPTPRGPGTICEYGWYDEEVERGIYQEMINSDLSRDEAIIKYFNML